MAVQTNAQQTNSALLRRALLGNCIFSGVSGIVLIAGAGPIASFLGWDAPLVLAGTGVILALYAVTLYQAATRDPIEARNAHIAIALDVAWVIGSAVILLEGWLPLTTAGVWAVAIVAEIVALFALVQYVGLRRMRKSRR